MKSLTFRACLAMAVIGLSVCTSSLVNAQQNTLRWNLKEGQKFTIETNQVQNNTMSGIPGGDQEMEITQDSYMNWEVKSVEGDKFTIIQTITRMKMNMDMAMMQIEYDSDEGDAAEGPAQQVAQSIGPIIDAEVTFVMDSKGNISDVNVPEEVTDAISGAGGGMGMGMPGPDLLEQMAKQASLILPDDPVTGDSEWTSSSKQTTIVEMTVDNTYKYAGQEDVGGNELHKINVTSEVTLESDELPGGAGTMELDKMDVKGTIWFDNNNGFMSKSEAEQEMSMAMSTMGIDMNMTGTTKITVKMTPVKD